MHSALSNTEVEKNQWFQVHINFSSFSQFILNRDPSTRLMIFTPPVNQRFVESQEATFGFCFLGLFAVLVNANSAFSFRHLSRRGHKS